MTSLDDPHDCPKFSNNKEVVTQFLSSSHTSADVSALNGMCHDNICPVRLKCMNIICETSECQDR